MTPPTRAMPADAAEARRELWRRYDSGAVSAEELEARLRLVDAAGDDVDGLAAALERRVPVRRRARARRAGAVAGAVVVVVALAAGAAALVGGGDGSGGRDPGGGFTVETVVGVGGPLPPGAVPPAPDCEPLGPAVDLSGEQPANPSLLSDPPFVPEGYEHEGDDDDIGSNGDPDIAMSTAAGTPAPVEILGRDLDGRLVVRLRGFRYASADDATAATDSVSASACGFGARAYETGSDEIGGSVVSGPIPTTAFASWRLGDRRFIVAVETRGEEEDDLAEARALATAIAVAELDAARAAPPPG